MRLLTLIKLKAMFHKPEELIGRSQGTMVTRREIPFVGQSLQTEHCPPRTHPAVGPAMDTLQTLHQKLDVAE